MPNNLVERWFLVVPGSKPKSVTFAPPTLVPNLDLCGYKAEDPEDLPLTEARYRLRVVRFNGLEVVVRPPKQPTATATVKLGAAHRQYTAWCQKNGIMLNSANPADSLTVLPGEAATEDDVVRLGEEEADRPPEGRPHDTKVMMPRPPGSPPPK